jgi:hypothetical protein
MTVRPNMNLASHSFIVGTSRGTVGNEQISCQDHESKEDGYWSDHDESSKKMLCYDGKSHRH